MAPVREGRYDRCMTVSFQLPPEIASASRDGAADIERVAKEALLVDLYRRQVVTHKQLSEALELSWYDTEGLLKRHGVMLDYGIDDLEADRKAFDEVLSQASTNRACP